MEGTECVGVSVEPFCQPGILDVDGLWLDRILVLLHAGLVHDIVEQADAVVHVPSLLAFPRDPVQEFIDFVQILGRCLDFLHFYNSTFMSGFDCLIKSFSPSWRVFDMLFQLRDYRMQRP